MYKRTIQFTDKNNNSVKLNIEITRKTNHRDYETLVMLDQYDAMAVNGECSAALGAILDEIHPRTETQTKLVNLLREYNLNDLQPGTKEQQDYLKEKFPNGRRNVSYLEIHKILEDKGLFDSKYGRYEYGSAWLVKRLPTDLYKQLDKLCDDVKKEDVKYINSFIKDERISLGNKITESTIKQVMNKYGYQRQKAIPFIALCLECNIPTEYGEEVFMDEGESCYAMGGKVYYVGTKKELETIARRFIEDYTEIWQDAVANNMTNKGLEDFARSLVETEGFVGILNRYDGRSCNEYKIGNSIIYVTRG